MNSCFKIHVRYITDSKLLRTSSGLEEIVPPFSGRMKPDGSVVTSLASIAAEAVADLNKSIKYHLFS